ncbi:MAG: F0F1 ATP synthase subunit B [Solobacterium sp.]|nr:F0F1 ATP synthase subunit B [Solobacterium sp.]MDY2953526.1 F0F1 ATP synthase subunit B [Erysipelotrichaceae bacterium]MCI6846830.1 F0F1 ATP synthase subunit B [Solobacterium sp.]MCI6877449.1 F0F1 ATP synthase subunit B [Solobacterium sp.]MCI7157750.1 F0F1 ATP synthase subunit B [Solobacterium sp.]
MTFDIQGVLFPNWITMLVQLCSTLVLFLLCKKLLWKPARDILAKRRDKMNENLMSSQKLREDASVELDKAKEELEHARNRSGEIVESARKEAENLRAEIVNKANSEASAKLALADKEIEQKERDAQDRIHDEMVDVAMAAVSKLMQDKATSSDDKKAIEDFIGEKK